MSHERLTNREIEKLRQGWQSQLELESTMNLKPRALRADDVLRVLAEVAEHRKASRDRDLLPCAAPALGEDEAHIRLINACLRTPGEDACAALCALRRHGWRLEFQLADDGFAVVRVKPAPKKTQKDGGRDG